MSAPHPCPSDPHPKHMQPTCIQVERKHAAHDTLCEPQGPHHTTLCSAPHCGPSTPQPHPLCGAAHTHTLKTHPWPRVPHADKRDRLLAQRLAVHGSSHCCAGGSLSPQIVTVGGGALAAQQQHQLAVQERGPWPSLLLKGPVGRLRGGRTPQTAAATDA